MHPTVALYFGDHSCLIVPIWPTPHVAYEQAALAGYTEDPRLVGKLLKGAMAVSRRSPCSDPRPGAASNWPESYRPFWESPQFGTMVLRDHQWIIYCGNECSPELPLRLSSAPSDDSAGEAFFALHRALLATLPRPNASNKSA